MEQVIIYPTGTGIAVIHPCEGANLEEVAAKDVPHGVAYRIIDAVDLPDRAFRGAWEADFSEPDGVGLGAQRWFIQQAEAEIERLELLESNDEVLALIEQQQQIIATQEAELEALA